MLRVFSTRAANEERKQQLHAIRAVGRSAIASALVAGRRSRDDIVAHVVARSTVGDLSKDRRGTIVTLLGREKSARPKPLWVQVPHRLQHGWSRSGPPDHDQWPTRSRRPRLAGPHPTSAPTAS